MALSKEWTLWHLTPRGWERGSTREDFRGVTEVEPPTDRVLSFEFYEHVGSMYGKPSRSVTEKWRGPDGTAVAQLLEKFGPCPETL